MWWLVLRLAVLAGFCARVRYGHRHYDGSWRVSFPRETYREEYALEYGSAAIEIHCSDFAPGTRVLLLDDLLATGGTLVAAAKLVERANLKVTGVGALLELEGLGGREALDGYRLETLSLVSEYPLPSK